MQGRAALGTPLPALVRPLLDIATSVYILPVMAPTRLPRRPRDAHALRLPAAELDVLTHLRTAGEATAAEIGAALASHRPMAHGSVATLLVRLEAKGLVTRRRAPVGKAFLYQPTARAEGALRGVFDTVVARLFGEDRMLFVASLLESKPPTLDEIDRLQGLLSELRSRRAPARKARP